MRTRLFHLWEQLTSSYWFTPAIMLVIAFALAIGMLQIDRSVLTNDVNWWWLYGGGAEGARSLLSTVAGSVITVAGVVFSITIVALTQASSQFGPRLLRNFMQDTGNQIVLGTFVSTFVYCLIVLRAVRGGPNEEPFVPHLATMVGLALAVASLCVLIFFIHHVSLSIQAPQVVARVAVDVNRSIRRMFPEHLGEGGPAPPAEASDHPEQGVARRTTFPEHFDREAVVVAAPSSGYIQAIDSKSLMSLAIECGMRMKLPVRPGKFVVKDGPLQFVWPEHAVNDEVRSKIQDAYFIGRDRTPEQDVEFVIDQLVEIALRALSTSVNDPFTAITCIDWLGVALARIARSDLPSPYRYDKDGELRMIVHVTTFKGVVDEAFDQIRQNGASHPAIMIRMIEVIGGLGHLVRNDRQCDPLRRQAKLVRDHVEMASMLEEDRADFENRYRAAMQLLQSKE